MKILTLTDNIHSFTDNMPFAGGGAEMAAYRLVGEYIKRGHQNIVVTTVQPKGFTKFPREELVDGTVIYKIYANYHERWRAYLSLWHPLVWRLKEILKKEKPDVVHIHNIHKYFSYYSLKIIKQTGIPIVLTVHDCMPICYKKFTCFFNEKDLSGQPKISYKINLQRCLKCQRFRYFPLRNLIVRYFLNKYPNKIIAVSQELKSLLNTNGVRCDDFIHHGVELNDFQIRLEEVEDFKSKFNLTGKKIIFFGGRLSYAKGIEHLIRAVKLLAEKCEGVLLLIAGQANDDVLNLIEKLGLEEKVLITGWLGNKNLLCAYAVSNIVVFPSLCFDTFGLMNLEAMAMKKSVITTCFGGSKEIVVDGVTGYVVNPLDIEKMADKIEDLLDNSEKAKAMGEAGHQRVLEKFTLDKEVNAYLDIFSELKNKNV